MSTEVIYNLNEKDIKCLETVLMMKFLLSLTTKDPESLLPDAIHKSVMQYLEELGDRKAA